MGILNKKLGLSQLATEMYRLMYLDGDHATDPNRYREQAKKNLGIK